MATGTGVTGLTVNFPDEMVVQVNHSAAIDEGGKLRSLGRLHLDLAGRPFANAGQFRMEHDLRKSVITALAETPDGSGAGGDPRACPRRLDPHRRSRRTADAWGDDDTPGGRRACRCGLGRDLRRLLLARESG